jgi:hypothetical protein
MQDTHLKEILRSLRYMQWQLNYCSNQADKARQNLALFSQDLEQALIRRGWRPIKVNKCTVYLRPGVNLRQDLPKETALDALKEGEDYFEFSPTGIVNMEDLL